MHKLAHNAYAETTGSLRGLWSFRTHLHFHRSVLGMQRRYEKEWHHRYITPCYLILNFESNLIKKGGFGQKSCFLIGGQPRTTEKDHSIKSKLICFMKITLDLIFNRQKFLPYSEFLKKTIDKLSTPLGVDTQSLTQ